jgi:hypothetical protein
MVDRLLALTTKGTRAIIPETMSLESLQSTTTVLDGQPKEEAVLMGCLDLPRGAHDSNLTKV